MANDKEKVALGSVAASATLTILKAVVGLSTGSLAILSEAGHSLIDLAATLITFFALRVADKPADEEHHYGHGKVESVAALAETALLFVLAIAVLWEAASRLLSGAPHVTEATLASFVVMLTAVGIDIWRVRLLSAAAMKHTSQALEAGALHFRTDLVASSGVLVGLVFVKLGYGWADSVAAIGVAAVILVMAYGLARRTIDALTDTAPPGSADKIATLAKRIPGVVTIEQVRARQVGAALFVEIAVGASRALPLDRVAQLKSRIGDAIRTGIPGSEVNVNVIPRALDDETVTERIMVIARNRALAVHHVTFHAIAGNLSVSLDLEVDGRLTLAAAHDIASGLEDAIREELGMDVEVESHIEPLQTADAAGRDAPRERISEVEAALSDLAAQGGLLRNIHDVRVRETDEGEIVNFHCDVDAGKTVIDVHELVDEVERGLRRRFSYIKRVIGHAEPRIG